jgi:hypothetical protein
VTAQQRKLAGELYWDLAITRKFHDAALRAGHFDDVNRYAKYLESLALRSEALLSEIA